MIIYFTNSIDKRKAMPSFYGGYSSNKKSHIDLARILESKYQPYTLFARFLRSQMALIALNSLGKAKGIKDFQGLMSMYLKSYWLKWLAQGGGHIKFSKLIDTNPTPLIDTAQYWKNLAFAVSLNNMERHKLSLYFQGRIDKLNCYKSFGFKLQTDPRAR